MAPNDASISKTYMYFSIGMPRTGLPHRCLCFVVPFELLSLVEHQLLHGIGLIGVPFHELPIVVGEPQKLINCVSVLGAFHVNTASITSHSLFIHHPAKIFYLSLRISDFDGLRFKPALFMQLKTSSYLSI